MARPSSYKRKPRGHTYEGRGAYQKKAAKDNVFKRAVRDALSLGGGMLGGGAGAAGGTAAFGPIGGAAGGIAGRVAGQEAGRAISRLIGTGAYQVAQNTLLDVDMGSQIAAFGNMSNATRIQHREFVQDIITPAVPAAFTNVSIKLNPGLRSVFPWLSGIASNYQEYQFMGCVLEFKSLSSDSASALPLGSLTMASNYDTADPNYPDKRHMQNSQFCVSGKPSEHLSHPIECDPKVSFVPIKYTRTGGVPTGTDSRLYDHANVQIATEGLPSTAGQVLGELWITYDIALYKPQLGTVQALRDHFFGNAGNVGTIATASPLGTGAATNTPRGGAANGLGITLSPAAVNFPEGTAPGLYEITCQWIGAAGFCTTAPLIASGTNVILKTFYQNAVDSQLALPSPAGAASVSQGFTAIVELAQPLSALDSCAIAVTFGAAPNNYDFQVAAVPSNQL